MSFCWCGAEKRFIGRGQSKLSNCSIYQPVDYNGFPACVKGDLRITSVVIIFFHYSVHLLYTVNITRRRDKQRQNFKNLVSKHTLSFGVDE